VENVWCIYVIKLKLQSETEAIKTRVELIDAVFEITISLHFDVFSNSVCINLTSAALNNSCSRVLYKILTFRGKIRLFLYKNMTFDRLSWVYNFLCSRHLGYGTGTNVWPYTSDFDRPDNAVILVILAAFFSQSDRSVAISSGRPLLGRCILRPSDSLSVLKLHTNSVQPL